MMPVWLRHEFAPFVVLRTRMVPGDFPGRLGHRGAPRRGQGDGWRADQRAAALPALSMLPSIHVWFGASNQADRRLCSASGSAIDPRRFSSASVEVSFTLRLDLGPYDLISGLTT